VNLNLSKNAEPFQEIFNLDQILLLQEEGISVKELRKNCQGSFQNLVKQIYKNWSSGEVSVKRNWGSPENETLNIIYENNACLLPEDVIFLKKKDETISNFKLVTWNVNSIRSRMTVLLDWLKTHQPEVICLQETKVEDSVFPAWELEQVGYRSVWYGQKTYNGVAILSKQPLTDIYKGFENKYDSENARLISGIWRRIRIINVYVPQGQNTESEKFVYKLEFLEQLYQEMTSGKYSDLPIIMVGDFNVALEPGDVNDPEAMMGCVSYHHKEHEKMDAFFSQDPIKTEHTILNDMFRCFNTQEHQFTWWDFRTRGFERGEGMRIDHILASSSLVTSIKSCIINSEVRGAEKPSDHAPVICEIEI
jgi:exodeoxyribonuclease III